MASATYKRYRQDKFKGVHDFTTGTYKAALLGTGYVYSDAHDFMDDVNAQEVNGAGYASGYAGAGRITLTTVTVTDGILKFDSLVWAGLGPGFTVAYIVIYKHHVNDATSEITHLFDINDIVTDGTPVTFTVDATLGAVQAV